MGCIGIMEKKMETIIMGYIGAIRIGFDIGLYCGAGSIFGIVQRASLG